MRGPPTHGPCRKDLFQASFLFAHRTTRRHSVQAGGSPRPCLLDLALLTFPSLGTPLIQREGSWVSQLTGLGRSLTLVRYCWGSRLLQAVALE